MLYHGSVVLCYAVTVQYRTKLLWCATTVVLYSALQWSAALHKLVCCSELCCAMLWHTVWCGVVWCGVVWCTVVYCGVVWCGVVWCGVVWCGVL